MGKSYRKTTIIGHGGRSEKDDKRLANRALRHRIKNLVKKYPHEEIFPVMREISDVWSFNKDGKGWFGDIPHSNSTTYPHERYFDDPYWVKLYREMKRK